LVWTCGWNDLDVTKEEGIPFPGPNIAPERTQDVVLRQNYVPVIL
jgi:hypothetical protein